MDYDQVYPGLFLGSRDYTVQVLKDLGIDVAVCIAPEEQVPLFNDPEIGFIRFPVSFQQSDDVSRDNLVKAKDACVGLLRDNKNIYLHCVVGYNRSPAVAVMVLQEILNLTEKEAIDYIMKTRKIEPRRVLKLFRGS